MFKKSKDAVDSVINILLSLDGWVLLHPGVVQPTESYRNRIQVQELPGDVWLMLDGEVIATTERYTEVPHKMKLRHLWRISSKKAENAIHARKQAKADKFLLETALEEFTAT